MKIALQLCLSATTTFLQFFWLALQPHLSATTFLQFLILWKFFWLALQPHLSATTTFLQFFLPHNNIEILRMNHPIFLKLALQPHLCATTTFLQFFWLHLSAATTFLQFLQFFWLAHNIPVIQPHLSATTTFLQFFLPQNNREILRMNHPVKIALQLCLSATTTVFLQFFWLALQPHLSATTHSCNFSCLRIIGKFSEWIILWKLPYNYV